MEVARLALEERPPRAPVCAVRIEAEATPSRSSQLDLFACAGPPPVRMEDTLARLAALSGEGRVGSPRPVDSHRPGAYTLVPLGSRRRTAGMPAARIGVPLRVLRPPERVEVRLAGRLPARLRGPRFGGSVLQCAGPWRLDGGWWEEALDRDYYEVELADGGIYRLFLDRRTERWFVDGVCG
jgi:protein ImuB